MESLSRNLAVVFGQLWRREGRAAWAAELLAVPRLMRWVLPWALLGNTRRDANPIHWLNRAAKNHPMRIAIRDGAVTISFGQLVAQTAGLASSFARQGVLPGQRVAILGASGHELILALLGCYWLGALPCLFDVTTPSSLLSVQLEGVAPDWLCALGKALDAGERTYRALEVPRSTEGSVAPPVVPMPARSDGLILPTSGTEGYPKLCRIRLGRLLLAGHSFGGFLLQARPNSVIYCPLPLTHATAVMAGLFPMLVLGCTLHLGGKFSATRFFNDVATACATHVLYVGDMLRFVMAKAPESLPVGLMQLERFVGNGLDACTWTKLAGACPNARIVEFYGATELPALVVNLPGRPAAMGRVPFRAWSRFRVAHLPENEEGIATLCAPMETGELLVSMPRRKWPFVGAFEGYWDCTQERRAFLYNVFTRGDCYYRTGDSVYFDENDFFYFVERVGDVWRHYGHNVSTSWVENELRRCRGVVDCVVVPVALDDSTFRVGLAVVVPVDPFDWLAFSACIDGLPGYARPELLEFVGQLDVTQSFKRAKNTYRNQVFSPASASGTSYFLDGGWHPCDADRFHRWSEGQRNKVTPTVS